ncbi:MAG: DUF423 domain-containing protein [Pseudomonadales bacterium]|nr:DUF423 domain-containing protein [Pseudomonadales bacterium]
MKPQTILALGALSAFLAVGFGAFGAHGLKPILSESQLGTYHTAVDYQLYHALALVVVAAINFQFTNAVALKWVAILFLAGTILFSGSLYLLVFTGTKYLGVVTPVGGLAFLAGWLLLVWAAFKQLAPHDDGN